MEAEEALRLGADVLNEPFDLAVKANTNEGNEEASRSPGLDLVAGFTRPVIS
jgi:hypothetical protein